MREMKLFFERGQLYEIIFTDPSIGTHRHCVRGRSGGAYRSSGSFQWTSAVKGLALLLVRAAACLEEPVIRGHAGSWASSLDYSLSKKPMWLLEMFGFDASGVCLIRRMLLRTNPERKRPGPTVLALNERFMPATAITIFADGLLCSKEDLIALAATLSREDKELSVSTVPAAA